MGLDVSHDCWHGSYSTFMKWRCVLAKASGLPPLELMEGFYHFTDITTDEVIKAVTALGFNNGHEWASKLLQALYRPHNLPIRWECLKPSPLHSLLNHSDCDGTIPASECYGIADALEALLPVIEDEPGAGQKDYWREKTMAFIAGLRLAAANGEDVGFH